MSICTAACALCLSAAPAWAVGQPSCPTPNGDAYSTAALADNPVGYYRMDETSGAPLCDSSTQANNGTYAASGISYGATGALTNSSDPAVSAAGGQPDGALAQSAAAPGGMTGNHAYTLEAWFKYAGTSVPTSQPYQNAWLVGLGGTGSTGQAAVLSLDPDHNSEVGWGPTSAISIDQFGADWAWDPSTVSVNLWDGNWHYIAVTYTPSSSATASAYTGYVDGHNLGSPTPRPFGNSVPNLAASPVILGNGCTGTNSQCFWQHLNGSLDEAAVYPTALSASRLSAHWLAGQAPVPQGVYLGNGGGDHHVVGFPLTANGNVAPEVNIGTAGGGTIAYNGGLLWEAGGSALQGYAPLQLGSSGSTPTPFVTISGTNGAGDSALAFDANGNLWGAAFGAHIAEYTPGQLTSSGSPTPAQTVNESANWNGMAFDSQGDMWVSDNNGRLVEFTPAQLASTSSITAPAVTISGGSLNNPARLAFDSAGDLWVANYSGGNVLEYTPSQLASSGSPSANVQIGGLNHPNGVSVDSSGDLWVATESNSSASEFTPGQLTTSGSPTPAAVITGGSTGINGPYVDAVIGPPPNTLTVSATGSGTVSSAPYGISCGSAATRCLAYYTPGTQVTLTESPVTGHTFLGWSGGGCAGTNTTCQVPMSQAQNVTATFTGDQTLNVTVTGSGTVNGSGIACPGTCSNSYPQGTQVTLTESPASDSSFTGWSGGGCSGIGTTCQVTMSQAQNVTATFTPNQILNVTLAGAGSGAVSGSGISCPGTCSHAYPPGTQVTLSESPASGSTFAGWSGGGCSGTGTTCQVTMSQAQNVTATFIPDQILNVTVAGSGAGRITGTGISCPGTCSNSYPPGTQVTLSESPASGSTFAGWSGGGCSGTGTTCAVAMSQAQSVTATFTGNQATLAVSVTGSGTVTSTPTGIDCGGGSTQCSADFNPGTQVTLTSSPASGQTFLGWSGAGCAGTSPCQITMSQDQSVTAAFSSPAPAEQLTVAEAGNGTGTVTGGGISCPGTCTASFPQGSHVTLTATAASGSIFAGWSGGGCSGIGTCDITMAAAQSVTATFQTFRALTVSTAGAGNGTVSGPGIACPGLCVNGYLRGTAVTLAAHPGSSSTFAGWSGGGCSGTGACTVQVSDDEAVIATFAARVVSPPRSGLTVSRLKGDGTLLPSGVSGVPVNTAGSCVLTVSELPVVGGRRASDGFLAANRGKPEGLIKTTQVVVDSSGRHYVPLIPTAKEIKLWRARHPHGHELRARALAAAVSGDPVQVKCQPVTFSPPPGPPPAPVFYNSTNVNPSPPPGYTVLLGGLDLDGFCRSLGDARSQLATPVIAPRAALAWHCITIAGQQAPIDFRAACQHQYPGFDTVLVADLNNGFSGQCWAVGHTTVSSGPPLPAPSTSTFTVPPPPPPSPLNRCFAGSNAAGTVHLCVSGGRVTSLDATINPSNGACTTNSSRGNSHSPFGDSASLPQPIAIQPDGSFGFNFPGAKVFNGQGQVSAAGGGVGVGIGTGPTAAAQPGGFTVCTAHANVNLR